ncbi:MAG: carboxypeptidase regulatory-like domain-containing protein [Spirochaetota bacterium]
MKPVLTFLLLILAAASAAAQEATILLTSDKFSPTDFSGALVLPADNPAEIEIIQGFPPSQSRDGRVSSGKRTDLSENIYAWEIRALTTGVYHFYVSSPFTGDNSHYVWEEDVVVAVQIKARTYEFRPPKETGLVWHVFDIIGEDQEVQEINTIQRRNRAVSGYVVDAVTGKAIPGTEVVVRDQLDGSLVGKTKTDNSGFYGFYSPEGRFSVEFSRDGYFGLKKNYQFVLNQFPLEINAALSPPLTEMQYRFVLAWGRNPKDLDAHMLGPDPQGSGPFHISFRVMKAFQNRHFLDRDDTESYGPETITLNKLDPGVYTYCVHDYTNKDRSKTRKLSYSEAVVRVYRQDGFITEITVPVKKEGNLWRVLQIDGHTGKIKILNEMTYEKEPDAVR